MKLRVAYRSALLAVTAIACGEDEWRGFVYPSAANLADHREIGAFKSLEACRASARAYLADINAAEEGDYECGLNCREDANLRINVCKETLR